jgi:diacylglycerol kinase (ATP)
MTDSFRVAAIVNPAAGGDPDGVVATLRAIGTATVDRVDTAAPGDAADLAYKLAIGDTPPDLVVSVGGDGTVCDVVTGLHRAHESGAVAVPPLLVAPAGTGNSTYRGLWNDAPWADVAAQALAGRARTRTIDLARMAHNEHVVVLGSGSGLFAASLLAIRNRPERGRELLMAAALAAMTTYVPYQGRVLVDDEVVYAGGIVETIVAGFRYRGGLLQLVPRSIVDDGRLDITIVTTAVSMPAFAQAAMGGNVYDVPGIEWARGMRIAVERSDGQPILFEHDGEMMPEDRPSYELAVLPGALTVLTTTEPLPWFDKR